MDFRKLENRREAFIRWFAWSLKYGDCDPAVWMTQYLNDRYEHNSEQKLWFCWLYANTYNLPTAWVLLNEFPDFELATVDRMEQWNTANYKRLRYQVDTKWNKGHLPKMFESYQNFIGNQTQAEAINYYRTSTPDVNFDVLTMAVSNDLHKFGRYSTWFYLQHLKQTAGVSVEPGSLLLRDYSGSRSHRNGLLFALGLDDDVDKKLSSDQYDELEQEGKSIIEEVKERFSKLVPLTDFFMMETALCSFKKIFRDYKSRYLGYYLDRQALEITKAEGDGWDGIEWDVLWQARQELLDSRLDIRQGKDLEKQYVRNFHETGNLERMDWMFDDIESLNNTLEDFFT